MGRRSDHSREDLRVLTLEAARRLLCAHGLEGLTARRVAAEIGYTPGTLYNIFENLDDLILHVTAGALDGLGETGRGRAPGRQEPERGADRHGRRLHRGGARRAQAVGRGLRAPAARRRNPYPTGSRRASPSCST